jgi:hypothetical protein|nr:MAG TPA: hypothetical protein [Caudoviricetes sp.]
MAEYITKKAAIKAVENAPIELFQSEWEEIEEAINAAPTADVAPVVRCKDCENAQNECGGMIICRVYKHIMWLNNFCSYGKRKGGGADND